MAGMKVVVVKTDDERQHRHRGPRGEGRRRNRANLAALMVTYPSTHGVFEEAIIDDLRDRPRARRPGLHGRREHERDGRAVRGRATSAPTSAT